MIYIVMGVSGSGKTTVGKALANRIGARFVDADDHHSAGNIAKMKRGIPLTDADRQPWLESLADIVACHLSMDESLVVACSALKQKYRDALIRGRGCRSASIRFIYLRCGIDTVKSRLSSRKNHFMPPSLTESQFADLEEPSGDGVATIDGGMDVEDIVSACL